MLWHRRCVELANTSRDIVREDGAIAGRERSFHCQRQHSSLGTGTDSFSQQSVPTTYQRVGLLLARSRVPKVPYQRLTQLWRPQSYSPTHLANAHKRSIARGFEANRIASVPYVLVVGERARTVRPFTPPSLATSDHLSNWNADSTT